MEVKAEAMTLKREEFRRVVAIQGIWNAAR
jgi:hypothetical protein